MLRLVAKWYIHLCFSHTFIGYVILEHIICIITLSLEVNNLWPHSYLNIFEWRLSLNYNSICATFILFKYILLSISEFNGSYSYWLVQLFNIILISKCKEVFILVLGHHGKSTQLFFITCYYLQRRASYAI